MSMHASGAGPDGERATRDRNVHRVHRNITGAGHPGHESATNCTARSGGQRHQQWGSMAGRHKVNDEKIEKERADHRTQTRVRD